MLSTQWGESCAQALIPWVMSFVSVETCVCGSHRDEETGKRRWLQLFCRGRVPYKTAVRDSGGGATRNTCCIFIAAARWQKHTTSPTDKMEELHRQVLFQMRVPTNTHTHTHKCTLLHLSVVHYSSEAALLLLKVFTTRNTLVVKNAASEKRIFSWINMHITALTGTVSQPELIPRS